MNRLLNIVTACLSLILVNNNAIAETLSTSFETNEFTQAGMFFNVTAKSKDVYITGFDLEMSVGGIVRVYYKIGSYVGSETVSGDWTLLGSRNIQAGDSVAPIPLGGLTIPAGTSYGFYLKSDNPVRHNSSASRQKTYSNDDITIFGDSTSLALFGATNARTWSGSVHYTVLDLATTFNNTHSQNGNYVDITAKDKDIYISGFDINFNGIDAVQVYFKKGSYKGSETTPSDWLFMGQYSVAGTAGIPTELPIGGLVIPAGETYGFVFYTPNNSGIRYSESLIVFFPELGNITLNENYSNDDIAIFTDTAIGTTLFTNTTDDRVWNGRVHYSLPEKVSTQIAEPSLVAEGNFFDLTARDENVHVTSFDINYQETNTIVNVYYREGSYLGSENSSDGWILLGAANVTGVFGTLTELPVGGVTIPAGDTYGFLIHSSNCTGCMKYTSNGSVGNFGNSDLDIFTSKSRSGSFPFSGPLNSPRIWNGAIHYSVKEGTSCFVSLASNGNAVTFCL